MQVDIVHRCLYMQADQHWQVDALRSLVVTLDVHL